VNTSVSKQINTWIDTDDYHSCKIEFQTHDVIPIPTQPMLQSKRIWIEIESINNVNYGNTHTIADYRVRLHSRNEVESMRSLGSQEKSKSTMGMTKRIILEVFLFIQYLFGKDIDHIKRQRNRWCK